MYVKLNMVHVHYSCERHGSPTAQLLYEVFTEHLASSYVHRTGRLCCSTKYWVQNGLAFYVSQVSWQQIPVENNLKK